MKNFSTSLIEWHRLSGRKDLPWQIDVSPYKVWISEIMLQQTQVTTVIPYFEKFIKKFPDIDLLADSNIDEVLSLWSGLGYYARARNLYKTAEILKKDYNSQMPDSIKELINLPGIGRSTAGAILSLGFNKRAPILDANVKRVLCRYKDIREDTNKTKTLNKLWEISEELLPNKNIAIYNQSLMDLGASVCKTKNPFCNLCPISRRCESRKKGNTHLIPYKKKKEKRCSKKLFWLLPYNDSSLVYLKKRPNRGVWGGLWSFLEDQSLEDIIKNNKKLMMVEETLVKHSSIKHSFSHFDLEVDLYLIKSKCCTKGDSWKKINQLNNLGMPSPVIKVLNKIRRNGKDGIL